jgi:predicted extracellular nuclease
LPIKVKINPPFLLLYKWEGRTMFKSRFLSIGLLLTMGLTLLAPVSQPVQAAGVISLTGGTYTQDFDTLALSGTSSSVPTGWDFYESGSNANSTYTASNGSSTSGDTYSFGSTSSSERAFGGLQSGSLNPTIGAQFANNTGSIITGLQISYTGEMWRAGVTNRNAADRLDFQYSTDATSLSNGTWTNVDSLDFNSPNINTSAGPLDGNSSANRTAISYTLTGLNIANGATFWIRWSDYNIASSDDGLAVDDFSITPIISSSPTLSINDVSQSEGNSGTSLMTFTVTLSDPAPAGGVTFDIATSDGTATTADGDYVAHSLTGVSIPEGNMTYTFDVTINGDTNSEPNETFFVDVTNLSGAIATDAQAVGTILNDDVVIPVLSINDVSVNEGDSGTTIASFTISLDIAAPAPVTFDVATSDGTATAGSDYTPVNLSGATINTGEQTYTVNVPINGDTLYEPDETFVIDVTNISGAVASDSQGVGTILNDEPTPIYIIQGSGLSSPLVGTTQTIQGVVIGTFEYQGGTPAMLNGFYVQEMVGDGNPATSDGIFVYTSTNPKGVALGDLVRVTGTISEFHNQTQINATNPANISILGNGYSITPTDIFLPFSSSTEPEQYEGMLVRFNQTLYVTEHYQLGRFGQVVLSSTDRLYQPTHLYAPGSPEMFALQAANALNRIIVDDSNQSQNPDPILFGRGGNPLSASNTLRGGDTITNLTGVLTYTWGGNSASPDAYRIQPVTAMGGGLPNFVAANPRPETPPAVGGDIKVVSMNLLNYFNTFGAGNCTNGVGGTPTDCRGAEDATEFQRQSDKIVNAILAMNPDIIGFMEMENDGYGPTSAIQDLTDKINAVAGAGTYAFLDVDTLTGQVNALGVDAIKVGLLYKPSVVMPVGNTAVLDSVEFVNGGDSVPRNRVSLLQAFQTTSGARFLVNVNHLKSKGSPCDTPDTGDGQGNCSIVRTNAVNALTAWLTTDPTGTGDPDILILGDMNSYAMEDPITAFQTAGYTDMVKHYLGTSAYSFVFDGQWGYLDYALGSPSLLAQTTSVAEWHINADEPSVLDYNTNYKSAGQIISLYSPEPYRSSDHDPILVGLSLDSTSPTVSMTSTVLDPTNASPIPVTVTFSEAVTGFTASDITVTNGTVSNFSGSGAAYTFDLIPSTNGLVTADIAAGVAFDAAGNANTAAPQFSRTYDGTAPTVLSITRQPPLDQVVTSGNTVTFRVTFSEDVTSVDTGDFSLTLLSVPGSNASISSINQVSASTYDVTVNVTGIRNTKNMRDGAIRLDIPNTATIQDLAGNALSGLPYTGGEIYSIVEQQTFADVSPSHALWTWIERLFYMGITAGCDSNNFCPTASITRAQMAVFLLRGEHGYTYTPPAVGSSTGFNDVPVTHPFAAWIKQLAAEGITSGCGGGNYCPNDPVTRAQMAVFLLRAEHGGSYTPPSVGASTGFNDVPVTHPLAAWIKQLAAEGITTGCGGGNYCPNDPVTRAQMAVFIIRTFNLP